MLLAANLVPDGSGAALALRRADCHQLSRTNFFTQAGASIDTTCRLDLGGKYALSPWSICYQRLKNT
jgi:hypothetical protein